MAYATLFLLLVLAVAKPPNTSQHEGALPDLTGHWISAVQDNPEVGHYRLELWFKPSAGFELTATFVDDGVDLFSMRESGTYRLVGRTSFVSTGAGYDDQAWRFRLTRDRLWITVPGGDPIEFRRGTIKR
jgi:hypothetical protein